jgi:DNA-binding NtrC family response regulator
MRILVVDSDARSREVLVQRMRSRGLDVDSAEVAAEAVALLSVATYDFVLLELVMPNDGALAVMAWIARMRPAPRSIVMSGVADLWRRANPDANVAGVLQKPFTIDELLVMLHTPADAEPRRNTAPRAVFVTPRTARDTTH